MLFYDFVLEDLWCVLSRGVYNTGNQRGKSY